MGAGQLAPAIQSYRRATRYTRKASVFIDLGQAQFKAQDYKAAQTTWEKARSLAKGPEVATVDKYLSIVSKKLK